jgi:hypothetical protein
MVENTCAGKPIGWNDSIEPFQSIRQIESLRNELVHYKADMAGRDSPPTKLISSIFSKFKLSDTARWIEDDVSTWTDTILEYKELGLWIAQTLEILTSTLFSTLMKPTQS